MSDSAIFTIYQLLPEVILFGMILVILLIVAFQTNHHSISISNSANLAEKINSPNLSYWLSFITLIICTLAVIEPYLNFTAQIPFVSLNEPSEFYLIMDMAIRNLVVDLFKVFILVTSLIALVCSKNFLQSFRYACGEYWVVFLICVLGMIVAVSASNLLLMFIGLEIMALAFYVLIAMHKKDSSSLAAAMKYFVLGSFASALFLFGVSFVYGAIGSFDLIDIMQGTEELISLSSGPIVPSENGDQLMFYVEKTSLLLSIGLVFIVVSLAFKLAAVPFHLWIADVYDDAHNPIISLLASSAKIVAAAVMFRILIMGFYSFYESWQVLLSFLAAASIILGNIAAIVQQSFKRMLAYSSISHAGFLLLGFISGNIDSVGASIFYIFSYALTSVCAFGIISAISNKNESFNTIDSLKGLHNRHPILALLILILMFSMAGIPPFIGFYAKFGVIQPLIVNQSYFLAIIAILFSVVGAYYYLQVVKVMYFDNAIISSSIKISKDALILLSLSVIIIVLIGLFPDALLSLSRYSLFLEQVLPKTIINL